MHRSNTGILGALGATGLLALALAGCGGGSSTTSSSASACRLGLPAEHRHDHQRPSLHRCIGCRRCDRLGRAQRQLGSILVAGPKRRTVYLFAADKGPASTCSSACAEVWPPVTTTGNPKAAGGAVSADLGTITRSDGTKQVTYKGHPLYYYVGDPNSGDTSGQGINSFGAPWYVLSTEVGARVK